MSGSSSGSKRDREEAGGRKSKGIRWDEQNLEENERIKKELNPRKIDEPKTPYLSPMDTDEEGDAGHRVRPLALDDPATAAAAAAAVTAAADAAPSNGTSDEAGTSGASGGRGRGRHVRIGGRAWSDSDRTVSPSPRHPDGGSPERAARSPRFLDAYYGEHDEHEEEEEEGDGEQLAWLASPRRCGARARQELCRARQRPCVSAPPPPLPPPPAEGDPQRLEKRRRFKEARKQHYNMREQLARARELREAESDLEGEDLAAAERETAGGGAWEHLRGAATGGPGRLANGGGYPEGHFDADVESEQEGGAAQRQRGCGGGLPSHPLPAVSGHPLPAISGHPLAGSGSPQGHPLAAAPVAGHPLAGSPQSHQLPSTLQHALADAGGMS